jgi:DNA-binding MarR family transcriptional regulator
LSLEEKDELLVSLLVLLESFVIKMKHGNQHLKSEENLADGQIMVLFMLSKQGECKSSDIAHQIGITSGAVTGMTDKLVNMQLINRERCDKDRRVVRLSLTEQGKATLARVRASKFQRLNEVFSKLSKDELHKAVEVFARMNEIIEEDNKRY